MMRLGILQGFWIGSIGIHRLIEEGGVPPTRPLSQAPSKAFTPSVDNNDGNGSGETDCDGGLGTTAIAGIALGVSALCQQEVMDDDNDDDRMIKRHSVWHKRQHKKRRSQVPVRPRYRRRSGRGSSSCSNSKEEEGKQFTW